FLLCWPRRREVKEAIAYTSTMPRQEALSRTTLAHTFLTFLLLSVSLAQSPEKRVPAILARTGRTDEPGVAVLVRRNGESVMQFARGLRDLRSRTRIDQATNFRLASCTKQFTAMAIMLLVHDGKLRYDERLSDIFPQFPQYGQAITIRHLLNHVSGLPDYEE